MRYLHGDSDPFPLNENFLGTLCAATDACVGLFEADIAAEHARQVTEKSERAVIHELERVERLCRSFERALGPHCPEQDEDAATATQAAALKICELGHTALDDTRASIGRWRDRTIAAAVAAIPSVDKIAAAFLLEHQLPGTTWSFEWKAELRNSPGSAVMHSVSDAGLAASYEVVLPAKHLWAEAVPASRVVSKMTIPLRKKGLFGQMRAVDERLDRLFVTHVKCDATSTVMTLRASKRDPSPGVELTVKSTLSPGVSAVRVDALGTAIDDRVVLLGASVEAVQRLWESVEASIADIACHRRRLVSATFEGKPIASLEKPGIIADAIIESLEPFVADMLRHGRTRGELCLKRDLGDGKREEMFLAHDEVTKRWELLPPMYQARFDGFDLEDGRTNVLQKPDFSSGRPSPLPVVRGSVAPSARDALVA